MHIELVEKTYGKRFINFVKIEDVQKFYDEGGRFDYDEEKAFLLSDDFLQFLERFNAELQKVKPKGWQISNDDYYSFLKKPYVGGNANIINDVDYVIQKTTTDGSLFVTIEIDIRVTLEK